MTEEDLEQLSEDWPRMREEISLLKKQNSELREDLKKMVVLGLALYHYIGADKLSTRGEDLRTKIVKLLGDLQAPVE